MVPGAVLALIALPLEAAWAGDVEGVVKVSVTPAKRAERPINKDGAVCGKSVPDETVRVGAKNGLADVVVSVRGLAGAAPPGPATLDQIGCRYVPHVQAVTVGSKLTLVNSDAVFHNVHAHLPQGKDDLTVFNLAMPFKGQRLPAALKRPGYHRVRCDAGHGWMSAIIAVFDHPYFAVTDQDGRFTIKGLPAGAHTLELWHEGAGGGAPVRKTVPVVVGAKVARVQAVLDP